MKLAVFIPQPFWFDGHRYSTGEPFINFVTSLHPYFEKIVFCARVAKERKIDTYILDPVKTEVCPLPYFDTYSLWKNLFMVFPQIYQILKNNIHNWDAIWLHTPHPVSLLFAYICKRQHKPFFLVVRQNLIEQVRHRNRGMKRCYAVAVVAILGYIFQRLAENNLTFTVGKEMYNAYKKRGGPVYQVAISLVSEKDIEETVRTRNFELHKPVRLLSVGRLDTEKAIHFLIEAIEELIKKKRLNVVLQIVGEGLKGTEEKRLHQEVEKRQLTRHIRFLGYVTHGPELFKLYRDSDIFVLSSLTEGFPQTLFEAMACGIPIIATKVGGIPHLVEDEKNCLLINPGSPSEICRAIEELVSNSELRDRLVKNALSMVTDHTLQAERDRMVIQIQRLTGSARKYKDKYRTKRTV